MLKSIESLDYENPFAINFQNKLTNNIYKIDSINLIIGKNGSGKTKAIKSIISEIRNPKKSTKYFINGDLDQLGVIYYTPVPFHKKINSYSNKHIGFIDASSITHKKQSFSEIANDFIAASELIDAKHQVKSIKQFSIIKIAEKIADIYINNPNISAQSRILNYTGFINRAKIELLEAIRKKENEEQILGNNIYEKIERTNTNNRIKELSFELKNAKENFSKSLIEQAYHWPSNLNPISAWIAISIYIEQSNTNKNSIPHIIESLYEKNIHPDNPDEELKNYLELYNSIHNILDSSWQGNLEIKRSSRDITININLTNAINEVDPSILEDAHNLNLLEIKFHGISSGQAAIYHQLINITQSIENLAKTNKRNIILFIDEGDMLLHLDWQRKYLNFLDTRLGNLKRKLNLGSIQLVIATHSPLLASDVFSESIINMDNNKKIPALGASLQKIVNNTFGTPAIGHIAENIIINLDKKKQISHNDIELINQIDDEFIRHHLLAKKQHDN